MPKYFEKPNSFSIFKNLLRLSTVFRLGAYFFLVLALGACAPQYTASSEVDSGAGGGVAPAVASVIQVDGACSATMFKHDFDSGLTMATVSAHCVTQRGWLGALQARRHITASTVKGVRLDVVAIAVHPEANMESQPSGWSGADIDNDIALIWLRTARPASPDAMRIPHQAFSPIPDIVLARLPRSGDPLPNNGWLVGWGCVDVWGMVYLPQGDGTTKKMPILVAGLDRGYPMQTTSSLSLSADSFQENRIHLTSESTTPSANEIQPSSRSPQLASDGVRFVCPGDSGGALMSLTGADIPEPLSPPSSRSALRYTEYQLLAVSSAYRVHMRDFTPDEASLLKQGQGVSLHPPKSVESFFTRVDTKLEWIRQQTEHFDCQDDHHACLPLHEQQLPSYATAYFSLSQPFSLPEMEAFPETTLHVGRSLAFDTHTAVLGSLHDGGSSVAFLSAERRTDEGSPAWTLVKAETSKGGRVFGQRVVIADSVVAVSEYGRIHIYKKDGSTWSLVRTLSQSLYRSAFDFDKLSLVKRTATEWTLAVGHIDSADVSVYFILEETVGKLLFSSPQILTLDDVEQAPLASVRAMALTPALLMVTRQLRRAYAGHPVGTVILNFYKLPTLKEAQPFEVLPASGGNALFASEHLAAATYNDHSVVVYHRLVWPGITPRWIPLQLVEVEGGLPYSSNPFSVADHYLAVGWRRSANEGGGISFYKLKNHPKVWPYMTPIGYVASPRGDPQYQSFPTSLAMAMNASGLPETIASTGRPDGSPYPSQMWFIHAAPTP